MAAQIGLSNLTANIAASASLSGQVDIGPGRLVGILVPAGWTAANVTFQASPDGGVTWGNLFSYLGTEFTVVAVAGQFNAIDPTLLQGVVSLKVRSGTSGSPVTQTGAVAVTLVTKL